MRLSSHLKNFLDDFFKGQRAKIAEEGLYAAVGGEACH
jgi:hypothetical protein